MTQAADEIINGIRERHAEYLEMSSTPDKMISFILADKVVNLKEQIIYLERRLEAQERYQYANSRR